MTPRADPGVFLEQSSLGRLMLHITNRRHFLAAAIISSVSLFAATTAAIADENAEQGISVIGTGTVKGKPTIIEMSANVSGEAELANDARVKYQDAKKKGLAALNALNNPDLSVEAEGPAVSQAVNPQAQMQMMQGVAPAAEKSKVQISESLKILVKGVDKLTPDQLLEMVLKMIDTCRDAGLQVGPPPATNYIQMQIRAQTGAPDSLVSFKIPDKTDLENRAYEQAVADAKAKAEKIAVLSGVKLGRVLSVKDQGVASGSSNSTNPIMEIYGEAAAAAAGGKTEDRSVSSDAPGDIPVSVHLLVTFEILKAQ
jgi:uncharacterized protein YggE